MHRVQIEMTEAVRTNKFLSYMFHKIDLLAIVTGLLPALPADGCRRIIAAA